MSVVWEGKFRRSKASQYKPEAFPGEAAFRESAFACLNNNIRTKICGISPNDYIGMHSIYQGMFT